MKLIFPLVIGGCLAAFGDQLQNWIVVFIGGIVCGVGLMYFVGAIVANLAMKNTGKSETELAKEFLTPKS